MDLKTFLKWLYCLLLTDWPEQVDQSLKPQDSSYLLTTSEDLYFDFIIVGAGSAGCVVANRLSENPDWKVLLIEAGDSENYWTDTPGLSTTLQGTQYDWNLTTTKQQHSCLNQNGICEYPSGHVMGGTSTINGMVYVRGSSEDYEEWEELGNPGWNYNSVLPYFLKAEGTTIPELIDSPYHSTEGPLSVSYSNYQLPISDDYITASREYGLQYNDYNGRSQIGVSYAQQTLRNGSARCSSSKAYLDPIRNRENLVISMNTLATKVLFSEGPPIKAVGIDCIIKGNNYKVYARKEVILSAGNFGTPKLLMLSGIGPKEHLQELKIPLVKNLPVGKYLADHTRTFLNYKVNISAMNCCGEFTVKTVEEYVRNRNGELTTYERQIRSFIEHRINLTNYTIGLAYGVDKFNNSVNEDSPQAQVLVTLCNPKSIGDFRLNSSNYLDKPLINPNYFGVRSDIDAVLWGIREGFKVMSMPALAKYSPEFIVDDIPECFQYYSNPITDRYLECYIMHQGTTPGYHAIGTSRMGNCSSTSVVDSQLRVHQINDLRVVDASVIPKMIRANTNAPAIMIGEKGSDYIKSAHGFC